MEQERGWEGGVRGGGVVGSERRMREQTRREQGGPQDCRDLVCFQNDTLEASNTFLGQVPGCLRS